LGVVISGRLGRLSNRSALILQSKGAGSDEKSVLDHRNRHSIAPCLGHLGPCRTGQIHAENPSLASRGLTSEDMKPGKMLR
jgi:hypothetical protein